jgi:hypothetical protein
MKRPWAVMLIAAVLVGCRPAQPATNPFLRTTVPPPATGQGAVVVPGEPYYPPAQAVPGAPPPVVAPAMPATAPVAAPPPIVAPPSDNRYAPPGGSFQYNQSSLEGSKSGNSQGRDHPTDETVLADAASSKVLAKHSLPDADALQQAMLLSSETNPVGPASYHEPSTVEGRELPVGDPHREPPELAANGENDASSPGNRVRILDAHSVDREGASADQQTAQSTEPTPVFRLTVEEGPKRDAAIQSPFHGVGSMASNASDSQVAVVTGDADSDTSGASGDGPPQAGADQGAAYAFAPDYAWLRGQLEYSQTSRQWKLRYIPIDGQTDQFGGSVVLPSSPSLEAFKPGDRVAVRGSLAAHASASGSFSPLYNLDQVEALSR